MNKVGVGVGIIVLNNNNEVLLILRNSDKDLADSDMRLEGEWTLPSGKVMYSETLEEASIRKLLDEVGLECDEDDLKLISISNDINKYAHYLTAGFITKKYTGKVKLKDTGEFTDMNWFNINNLPANLCIPSKKIINNYLNNKIYSDREM